MENDNPTNVILEYPSMLPMGTTTPRPTAFVVESGITYIKGDATDPVIKDGYRFITHICNDIGAWGAGFVLALSKKWDSPGRLYRMWSKDNLKLGDIQNCMVDKSGIFVVNMIAQHGCEWSDDRPPIRYVALYCCLEKVSKMLKKMSTDEGVAVSVHMPRIGCGLAGGEWNKVEEIINRTLVYNNIPVYVYDL
jgi:O-acetyl-ADP-ribose deacetylase (regulator of RNase III)